MAVHRLEMSRSWQETIAVLLKRNDGAQAWEVESEKGSGFRYILKTGLSEFIEMLGVKYEKRMRHDLKIFVQNNSENGDVFN